MLERVRLSDIGTMTVLGVLASALMSMPTIAQTPDGETPAVESVCDQLIGGTPGLYGLCVAFCEAQDFVDYGKVGNANHPAVKLLTNYRKRMAPGDPDMPCIFTGGECPIFNIDTCNAAGTFQCALAVTDVTQVFAGADCSVGIYPTDRCTNYGDPSDPWTLPVLMDRCGSNESPDKHEVLIWALGVFGPWAVYAHAYADGASNWGYMDYDTAWKCMEQLNTYDDNGPETPYIDPCGLAN
jgi:hypothetical protein